MLSTISSSINHLNHYSSLQAIISLANDASLITAANEVLILEVVNSNFEWLNNYLSDIETVLDGEQVEDATTAPPTDDEDSTEEISTESEETTTQGAGSLIASFSVILACAAFKMFV